MATHWKSPHPDCGPESYDALRETLLAGFVAPGAKSFRSATRCRGWDSASPDFRCRSALEDGLSAPLHALVEQLGMSDRWLHNHLPVKTALYAFPPPELAESLGATATSPRPLQEQVRGHVSPRALSLVGFFTDGLRTAFGDWVDAGQPSLALLR